MINGEQLRENREELCLTQEYVVVELGLAKSSASAVCDWEKGRERIPDKHQAKLKEILNL